MDPLMLADHLKRLNSGENNGWYTTVVQSIADSGTGPLATFSRYSLHMGISSPHPLLDDADDGSV